MLWLALRFSALPLEIFTRGAQPSEPLAVASETGAHAEIVAHNNAAKKRGVCNGMPLAAAFALDAKLRVVTRDTTAERAALERIAAWAIQFTPVVSLTPPAEVLLEISGSLTLFGGLNRLWTRITQGVRELGYTATAACTPTPLAAQLFVRAGLSVRIHHADALRLGLEQLPVAVLESTSEAWMCDIGVKTIEDILRLPRDGLARRCGQTLLDDLDRALGHLSDPRASYAPPAAFTAAQPLPAPAEAAEMVLFAARRLLGELCGFLSATAQGVQCLHLTLAHDGCADTRLSLFLVAATRDVDHLTSVLRERLERTVLPRPVTEIVLHSELLLPLMASNLSLLPDAVNQTESAERLIERLRARLGDGAVRGIKPADDYRPEHAWRYAAPSENKNKYLFLKDFFKHRPLWLLAAPKLLTTDDMPADNGPLKLLSKAERIDAGWWDGLAEREYFIARNLAGALLWIYRQRNTSGWFLHGYFA